jgi:hypothetical protein
LVASKSRIRCAGGELEGGGIARVLMAVEVFVARGNGRDSPGDYGFLIVGR